MSSYGKYLFAGILAFVSLFMWILVVVLVPISLSSDPNSAAGVILGLMFGSSILSSAWVVKQLSTKYHKKKWCYALMSIVLLLGAFGLGVGLAVAYWWINRETTHRVQIKGSVSKNAVQKQQQSQKIHARAPKEQYIPSNVSSAARIQKGKSGNMKLKYQNFQPELLNNYESLCSSLLGKESRQHSKSETTSQSSQSFRYNLFESINRGNSVSQGYINLSKTRGQGTLTIKINGQIRNTKIVGDVSNEDYLKELNTDPKSLFTWAFKVAEYIRQKMGVTREDVSEVRIRAHRRVIFAVDVISASSGIRYRLQHLDNGTIELLHVHELVSGSYGNIIRNSNILERYQTIPIAEVPLFDPDEYVIKTSFEFPSRTRGSYTAKLAGFPPELLDKYEPLEFLGEGGFAKVFKVRRRSDGKVMALKVSRLDEKAKKFFLKEVKAWRLLDHKNIVKLYNAFDEPLPHLEIEFVDGVEMNGKVIRDLGKYPKPVGEEKALHFVKGIAEGLKHAHSKQVYHRDLKLQNVLITSDLTPKITDWGLAKVGAVSITATTTKGLTLLYAAPEQLDDETYGHTDARTDIYQLGLIFYELLTGKMPYTGTSPAVVMAKVINPEVKPKPPSHYDKTLAKYDGIFEKLLAKRKEERYQSVDEFLNDLELMKKLDEERRKLQEEIEKTKTTMSLTTDSKELRKLKHKLVEQLSRNALLHAQLNDKAGLINALEDLKAFSKEHRDELENAIDQFELMLKESVPVSRDTLEELKILLHRVQKEVEG